MLVAHGIADPDLGVEIAALRIQHVDIIDAPAPVLQLGEFNVFPGCVAQVNLQRGRPTNAAVADHGVVGLLENRQHLLFIPQPGLVVGGQRGLVPGLFTAEPEDRRGERTGDIRERRTEKPAHIVVFPAARQVEHDAREAVGVGHARGGHRRTKLLLRSPHVGTPQEQFRRQPHGKRLGELRLGIHLAAHDPPVGIFAHEQRNAVFHDLDLAFEVGDQRRRRGVLHFRLLKDRFRGEAALETQLRLVSTLAARDERTPHDGKLVVERHQPEIGGGDLGHKRHLHRTPVLDRCEVFGTAFAFGPAQVSPQVELPAHGSLGAEFGVAARLLARIVVGFVIGVDRSRHRRQASGLANTVELAHTFDTRRRGKHVLVVGQRMTDDVAQGRIAVELPPLHVGDGERIGRSTPGDSRREIDLGRLAVTHGRAGAQPSGSSQYHKKYRKSFHRFSFSLIR